MDLFSIQCSNDGGWSGQGKCNYPLCPELKFDDATVKETIWGSKEGSEIAQGSILKLECLDQGSTFRTIDTVSRTFFECDKKKWKVTDSALCPNNENSCTESVRISCVFNGCSSLPPSFQDPVVYDPLMTAYLKDSSLTISCSNQVEPDTKFEAYSDNNKYLMIKKISKEMKHQDDPEFCLHDDCLLAAGITWNEKNGNSGKDCVKLDDDTATCLNPSKLELIQTSFVLKEGKKKQLSYYFKVNFIILKFNFSEDFENAACFQDHSTRVLPHKQLLLTYSMTPSRCNKACFIENNYAFSGLQNGEECFCGNKAPSLDDLLPKSECNTPCRGNNKRKCGAGMKNSIFKESGNIPFLKDTAANVRVS